MRTSANADVGVFNGRGEVGTSDQGGGHVGTFLKYLLRWCRDESAVALNHEAWRLLLVICRCRPGTVEMLLKSRATWLDQFFGLVSVNASEISLVGGLRFFSQLLSSEDVFADGAKAAAGGGGG